MSRGGFVSSLLVRAGFCLIMNYFPIRLFEEDIDGEAECQELGKPSPRKTE